MNTLNARQALFHFSLLDFLFFHGKCNTIVVFSCVVFEAQGKEASGSQKVGIQEWG